ncbi:MAG: COG4223 family protein [Rhizobiaceae bacterium]
MVKPPRVRHSKTEREAVTIDLEPGEVSRLSQPSESSAPVSPSADDAGIPTEPVAAMADGPTADTPSAMAETAAPAAPAESKPDETTAETKPQPEIKPTEDKPQERPAFGRDAARSTPGVSGAKASPPPPPSPPPRAAVEPKRTGNGAALLYGVLGGIVAIAIGWGLLQAGIVQIGGAPATPDNSALTALQAEVAGLKGEVDALKQAPAPEGVAGLQQAVDDSNARVAEFGTALEALRSDLATLRKAVESGGAGDGAAVQALATRVGEIEAAVAALGEGGSAPDPALLDALGKRIDTLETALSAAATAASATDGRIAQLEQSVADLARQMENIGGQPKVALAIASAALRAALERGGIFTAEVETFAAVAPPETDLAALRDIAAKGVSTRAQLAAEMPAAADAMIAAANTTAEDPGFFGGIVDGIGSLVTVRPIGEVPGPGVPETVARMEVAVQQGDLAKAMAEYDTLSEPAKAAGAALADKIRTRIAAEQLVDKALADALKGT